MRQGGKPFFRENGIETVGRQTEKGEGAAEHACRDIEIEGAERETVVTYIFQTRRSSKWQKGTIGV